MIDDTTLAERGARTVHANGIDIAYVEAGDGPPLVLLHGGLASSGPLWADSPVAYVAHMAALAKHFRVIAPDTRGSGATVHSDGGAVFGGHPEATEADPDAAEAAFRDTPMAATFATMQADYDSAQGAGHWRRYLQLFFD